jgi:uncharacterized glyoxalase superfamily protein PhnB
MKCKQIVPEFLVENIEKTVKFYTEVLDFSVESVFPENEPVFAQLKRDEVEIMLFERNEFSKEVLAFKKMKMGGTVALYMRTTELKEYYDRIKDKVTMIVPYHETFYGSREFVIEDCNGYIIYFSENV